MSKKKKAPDDTICTVCTFIMWIILITHYGALIVLAIKDIVTDLLR